MTMMLEHGQTVDDVLEEIVRRIVEAVHPEKIILFGSYARGNPNEHSDLDLMVVAPSDAPRWQRTKPILKALRGVLFPKDIVWYTPDEIEDWRGVPSSLVGYALQEGRVLYEKPA